MGPGGLEPPTNGLSYWNFPEKADYENNIWLNSDYASDDLLKDYGGRKSYFMLWGKRRLASSDTLLKYRIIQRADTEAFIYAKESVFCRRDTTCFVTGNSVPINDRTETLYEIESYQDRGAETSNFAGFKTYKLFNNELKKI